MAESVSIEPSYVWDGLFHSRVRCLGIWLRPMLDQYIGDCMVPIYSMNNGIKEPTQPVPEL